MQGAGDAPSKGEPTQNNNMPPVVPKGRCHGSPVLTLVNLRSQSDASGLPEKQKRRPEGRRLRNC
jgi:hypothetical protein